MRYEGKQYQVNGIAMNVVIEGKGPDILLVHGFPDSHDVWRHQIPVLVAAGFRVIAPDTRGCGASAILPKVGDYVMANLVADLVGLLDVLGIQKVRLVGHDWGAIISWHLAINHPERITRYVAISVGHPNAFARAGLLQKIKSYYILVLLMRGISEFFARQCNWLLFRLMTNYSDEFPRWRAQLSRPGRFTAGANYYRANPGMLRCQAYPSVKVPVLGIWSSADIFLTEAQMKNSAAYVQESWHYLRIEGANHWIPLSAPQQLNRALLDYLT
ncbi:MAG TPA: hypothetical protein DCW29_08030 [Janthinobacterium sp.]|nr:hypothetical protein [Janthinobacterium sp.]